MANSIIKKEEAKLKRTVDMYNMVPNLLWSILNLTPISFFCYTLMSLKFLYIFLGISLTTLLLPVSFFNMIQLGKTTYVYKKIGVAFINRFTQNGEIINKLIRKKFPQYQVISISNKSITRLLKQTYMFEKFHWILFLFFTLVTAYALVKNHFLWALVISVTNVLYNVYPNLLQQYIRIRLKNYQRRYGSNNDKIGM